MEKEKVKQPEWFRPSEDGKYRTGKKVRWYICGPTVYDSSHMGHARNYVTFDIIRRILSDYFGYEVFSVMNITDVDDKIILKARRTYLYDKYEKEHPVLTKEVIDDLETSWKNQIEGLTKQVAALTTDTSKSPEEKTASMALFKEKLDEAQSSLEQVQKASKNENTPAAALLKISQEPLAVYLDSKEGSTVTDQKIFRQIAAKYEAEYLEDMRNLGVRMPDVTTRVTEYIPEVISFVEKIVENGFGYSSNGSVYFDTKAFSQKFPYGKLQPWAVGNSKLYEEGEGALSGALGAEKKNPFDFALWKKSKPGEPFWDSPWGKGRPGWHIECSAMAANILGPVLDIHSGGVDLKFPHHDNELAQSEAFFGSKQWVNYFLHSGHLHINGLKMSKSLKNFKTIREILQKFTPRQMRLLFLLRPWDSTMNYTEDSLDEIKAKEKSILEFFLNAKIVLRDENSMETQQRWNEREKSLHDTLMKSESAVDDALKNSFDTPTAMLALLELIRATNVYISSRKDLRPLLIRKIAQYVTRILKVFGVIATDEIGVGSEQSGQSKEQVVGPFVDAFALFRTKVRAAALEKKEPSEFLMLSDQLRNEVLPPLGLRLEDTPNAPKLWKLDSPENVMNEIKQKKEAAASAAKKKLEQKLINLENEIKRAEQSSVPPSELFSKTEYSQFDAKGIPTHVGETEITKSARKKLEKTMQTQEKNYKQHQDRLAKDPNYIANMKQEKESIIKQLSQMTDNNNQ